MTKLSGLVRAGLFAGLAALTLSPTLAAAAETVKVYGPGGPAPAMKALAAAYSKANGVTIEVTAGPTGKWMDAAKEDADIIYSGSENMMLGFIKALEGDLESAAAEPMYLRPSTILVRKGNPKGIKGLRDIAKPGMKILVTEGAGQVGMWEDAAGRTADIELLKGFRSNIVEYAANSGLARKSWVEKPEIDAWLIWNHWQTSNPDLADQVPVEPELTIWRSAGIGLTKKGGQSPAAQGFLQYVKSDAGEAEFARWGWSR